MRSVSLASLSTSATTNCKPAVGFARSRRSCSMSSSSSESSSRSPSRSYRMISDEALSVSPSAASVGPSVSSNSSASRRPSPSSSSEVKRSPPPRSLTAVQARRRPPREAPRSLRSLPSLRSLSSAISRLSSAAPRRLLLGDGAARPPRHTRSVGAHCAARRHTWIVDSCSVTPACLGAAAASSSVGVRLVWRCCLSESLVWL
mmetsp:Transcript_7086/g.16582  ORF Transcript_7086/g.16582 Transcript_7086/m.16582 type:complete len:203 (+) Transcript_7086:3-611(+)